MILGAFRTNDQWRSTHIIRALEPEVVDAVWAAIEPLIPPVPENHPLGCHRPGSLIGCCFRGILVRLGRRLLLGQDVEALLERRVSDTTLRTRRDEWNAAGVFDHAAAACPACLRPHHRSRPLRRGTRRLLAQGTLRWGRDRKEPDRPGQLGWKWSIATDANGIPIGWAIDGAQRNDMRCSCHARRRRPVGAPRRDRDPAPRPRLRLSQYPYPTGRSRPGRSRHSTPRQAGCLDLVKQPLRLGLRWVVEGTNSWLSNYGQLRRNTDRRSRHRHAQLCLVTTLLITAKLIDWRDRWSPDSRPIR